MTAILFYKSNAFFYNDLKNTLSQFTQEYSTTLCNLNCVSFEELWHILHDVLHYMHTIIRFK